MGGSISSLFGDGVADDESSEDYLQLTDLGGFLTKYIFIMLDKDKRKLVSKQEYLTMVNQFREQKTTEEELDEFLKRHVAEGQSTDHINERLFRKLIVQLAMDFELNVPERMKYLMTLFDKDNDGLISESDLCQVYDAIGIQVPIEPIRSLISKYDEDGDNMLSLIEFEHLGRSAMGKLFSRREESRSPVDALVEEALRKGSEGILASMKQNSDNNKFGMPGFSTEDVANNNSNANLNNGDAGFIVVDDVVFGKPVKLVDLEAKSSLFSDLIEDQPIGETLTNNVFLSESGDLGEDVDAVLSDLRVEKNVEEA